MKVIERVKNHDLTLLEYYCMDILNIRPTRTIVNIFCRLEDRAILHKVTDERLSYNAVNNALQHLLDLGIAYN